MKRITANQYQTSERYYKLPKILFEDEKYMDMKLEVKVAYSILKDRLELSLNRGWIDEEGAVYLKKMRILRWSGEPQQYMQQMQAIMPFLNENVAKLLEHIPVYTLDKNNMRDVLIKKFAKKILIEQGKLTLDTGIF